MRFTVGTTVVHPVHGPVAVRSLHDRIVRGTPVPYAELHEPVTRLTIAVPVSQAENLGVRPVMDTTQIEALLVEMAAPETYTPQTWSRRIKDYELRLESRSVTARASVVRDIVRVSGPVPSSALERQLLRDSLRILASEVVLSLGCDSDHAMHLLQQAAAGQSSPSDAAVA